ncbi:type II secretion system protein [Burkholderia ubonensis]|uniref:Type II secretion system protein G n=1 Tax=Burkholderia ubonensis TaxID=101571 RepID=A0AAW3MP81_9BURK|nr:prepilin-type N-terminal cleavage/methylation domain-containing protein [Burkholderia ubonensis]KVK98983.1 type II secretion system protein G [Burkholderia ubonensis]KVN83150.1 type II secretion system protein G [Burkholderia ubonensis]KVO39551.1 type II secretion system protein G [Burkholderia ubonensis]KVP89347.1 type II secretion system protein G [Burkholderia ubonensis]KVQ54179.1 type II secretion system protein G [Burkholderia ubonensis]
MGFHTTSGRTKRARGFTLIELLVVMAIIATLMSLVAPGYFKQIERGKETVLRHNLQTTRTAIDDYRADHGVDPTSLQALVDAKYLRSMPRDPMTGRTDTWVETRGDQSGITDIHSSATGTAIDGTSYAKW